MGGNGVQILSLPITVAVVGWIVAVYVNHSAVSKDYVTLAVHILQDSTPAQDQPELRDWAVELLNHHSAVKLDPKLQSALKTGAASLPAETVPELLSQIERQVLSAEKQRRASMLGIVLPGESQDELRNLLKRIGEADDPVNSPVARRLLDRLPD